MEPVKKFMMETNPVFGPYGLWEKWIPVGPGVVLSGKPT